MALGLLSGFLGILAVFTAFNTRINPLWVTPSPWTDESYAPHRQIYSNIRTAKAGLARSLPWDVAFIGSSRVAIALDPDHPQWGETRAVNLGVSAASITEGAAVTHYVLKHQPGIRKILLGLDLTDLSSTTDLARSAGFFESPFNESGNAFERELRYIVGFSTAEASWKTLRARSSGELPPYTPRGHWARQRSTDPVRTILARDSVPFAMRFARQRKAELELVPAKTSAFRSAVRACLESKVRLTVFLPPNHAAFLSVFPMVGDPDPFFMTDRRAALAIILEENAAHPGSPPVELWDFSDFHPLNAEAIPPDDQPARFWVDGTHPLESLGNIMLARMEGWPLDDPAAQNYGTRLHAGNIDAREQAVREGHDAYRRNHPQDWEWVREITGRYDSVDAASPTPGSP